jgi:YopJ family protease
MLPITNQVSYTTINQNNDYNPVTKYIAPKSSFEQQLLTRSGLKRHITKLNNLYEQGIASNWHNAAKTDIYLLPKMLWLIRKKHPKMNLIFLELGVNQLELEITKLINHKVTTATLVFGLNRLSIPSNHFLMANYYLDASATTNKASIIFFNAGSENDNTRFLLDKSNPMVALKNKFNIKSLYLALGIQKSNVDCLLFSLELAKAVHKSSNEIQRLHLLNINNKLTESFTPEHEQAIIATGKPLYEFDRYIPISMMKHCQSSKRITAYITLRKICGLNTETILNKKQESLEARLKRFTKDKKFAHFNGKITTSFSIEYQRLCMLKKIEQQWDTIIT